MIVMSVVLPWYWYRNSLLLQSKRNPKAYTIKNYKFIFAYEFKKVNYSAQTVH